MHWNQSLVDRLLVLRVGKSPGVTEGSARPEGGREARAPPVRAGNRRVDDFSLERTGAQGGESEEMRWVKSPTLRLLAGPQC